MLYRGSLWLAKVGLPDDPFDMPGTEAAMLDLAGLCGIDAQKVETVAIASGVGALLVPRFDRRIVEGRDSGARSRRRFASALTLLRADELNLVT